MNYNAINLGVICLCLCEGAIAKERKLKNIAAVPQQWDEMEIAAKMPWNNGQVTPTILAYTITKRADFRVERCLVISETATVTKDRKFVLAVMCRNSPDSRWRVPVFHPTPQFEPTFRTFPSVMHAETFSHRPSNRDVYGVLDEWSKTFGWSFKLSSDDQEIVGVGVCKKSWKKFVGEEPTQFFSIENAK